MLPPFFLFLFFFLFRKVKIDWIKSENLCWRSDKKIQSKNVGNLLFQKGVFTFFFAFCFSQVVFAFAHSSNYYIFVWLVFLHFFNFLILIFLVLVVIGIIQLTTTIKSLLFITLHPYILFLFFQMLFLLKFIILTFSLYFLSRYNQIDKHF